MLRRTITGYDQRVRTSNHIFEGVLSATLMSPSLSLAKPDFDSAHTRLAGSRAGRGFPMIVEIGRVCRRQERLRIGGGALMLRNFNRLAAAWVGSVTCQTVPLGLNNCASLICLRSSRILRHVSAQLRSATRS